MKSAYNLLSKISFKCLEITVMVPSKLSSSQVKQLQFFQLGLLMPSFLSSAMLVALCHRCRAWMDPSFSSCECLTRTKVALVLTIARHCWCIIALMVHCWYIIAVMVQETPFTYSGISFIWSFLYSICAVGVLNLNFTRLPHCLC